MPETHPIPTDSAVTAASSPPASNGASVLGKLVVILFLAAIVLAECVAAYFYLPSPADTATMAAAALAAEMPQEPKTPAQTESENESESLDEVEVDLEQFSVTAFQPLTNTTLRIDFHLYGTVAEADAAEFQTLMQKNVHRFREQVIVIVRASELTDLTDAGLGLIKRKILEKTHRILGKPLLKSVIVSDFSFIEQ